MYYLTMRTAVKPDSGTKPFCISKNYICLKDKELCSVNSKFYQKLFVLLVSFSTILIFPESPRSLGNICESYNSRKVCNVW